MQAVRAQTIDLAPPGDEVYCPALKADGERFPYAIVTRGLLPWRRHRAWCSACGTKLPHPAHTPVPLVSVGTL